MHEKSELTPFDLRVFGKYFGFAGRTHRPKEREMSRGQTTKGLDRSMRDEGYVKVR